MCCFLALKEYKACLIFNKNASHDYYNELTSNKLFKRCKIVLSYVKNIQNSIINSVDSCKFNICSFLIYLYFNVLKC